MGGGPWLHGVNDAQGWAFRGLMWWAVWDQFLITALHTISISRQNSFCESHSWKLVSLKALRELNAHWALPLYPVSKNKKTNGSYQKSVKQKISIRINIIA